MSAAEKFVGFRADPLLAARAKEKAKSEHRSLTGYLRHLVEQDVMRGDRLREDPPAGDPSTGHSTAPAPAPGASYKKKAGALLKKGAKALENAGGSAKKRGKKKIEKAVEKKGKPVADGFGGFHDSGGLNHAT